MKISSVWLQSHEAVALCQRAEMITMTASPDTPSSLLLVCLYYTPVQARCRGFVNSVFGASEKLSTFIEELYLTCHLTPWRCLFAPAPIIIVTVADESECRRTGEAATGSSVSLPDTDISGTVITKATSEVWTAVGSVAVSDEVGWWYLHIRAGACLTSHRPEFPPLQMMRMSFEEGFSTVSARCNSCVTLQKSMQNTPLWRTHPVSHVIWREALEIAAINNSLSWVYVMMDSANGLEPLPWQWQALMNQARGNLDMV